MLTIYHNPRCSKSRAGLQYIQEKKIEHKIRLYLSEPLTIGELSTLVDKSGLDIEELIRTKEEIYKKEYKGKEISKDDWLKIITDNPRLLHRPLVENSDKVVWAQPPEKIDELL